MPLVKERKEHNSAKRVHRGLRCRQGVLGPLPALELTGRTQVLTRLGRGGGGTLVGGRLFRVVLGGRDRRRKGETVARGRVTRVRLGGRRRAVAEIE